MKTLFDTNVILDVLLDREPFSNDAALLLSKVEQSEIIGFICATTVTTIYYIVNKALGFQAASHHIQSLLSLFVICRYKFTVSAINLGSPVKICLSGSRN